MQNYNLEKVKSLISDIYHKKFKIINGKSHFTFTDKIFEDERYSDLRKWLKELYEDKEYGIKYLIKTYNLDISYTSFRHLLNYIPDITIHSNTIATKGLKEQRKIIAKNNYINKTGFFKDGVQESIKHKSDARGIQGYYWNESKQKYVWLRSSWEYIYAKWLNKQKINWDIEVQGYKLLDGHLYRPDFFIFDNDNNLIKIVEIKGFWKRDEYKPKLLNEQLSNIEVIIIDNIKPYIERGDIKTWKNIRKLKLNK